MVHAASMPGWAARFASEEGTQDRSDEAQDVADELEHRAEDAADHVVPPFRCRRAGFWLLAYADGHWPRCRRRHGRGVGQRTKPTPEMDDGVRVGRSVRGSWDARLRICRCQTSA